VRSAKRNSKSRSVVARKKRPIKKKLQSKRRSHINPLLIYTNQPSLLWKRRKAT
jgi:hypothetical protein